VGGGSIRVHVEKTAQAKISHATVPLNIIFQHLTARPEGQDITKDSDTNLPTVLPSANQIGDYRFSIFLLCL
jgi:hypothetical protein